MSYFRNFPIVSYNFGDEVTQETLYQNLTVYVDIFDQVVDDVAMYTDYEIIDGERPDTISYKLYGTVDHYWTLYMLNKKLRIQGWPLTYQEQYEAVKQYYPNKVITTQDTIHGEFYLNDILATKPFDNPTFKGKIIEKIYDLGQIIVKPIKEVRTVTITNGGSGYTKPPKVTFTGGSGKGAKAQVLVDNGAVTSIVILDGGDNYTEAPTVTIAEPDNRAGVRATATATLSSNTGLARNTVVYSQKDQPDTRLWDNEEVRLTRVLKIEDQADAVHHYEDDDGLWLDIPLSTISGRSLQVDGLGNPLAGGYNKVTYRDRMFEANEDLKRIKVIKPEIINQVTNEFKRIVAQ